MGRKAQADTAFCCHRIRASSSPATVAEQPATPTPIDPWHDLAIWSILEVMTPRSTASRLSPADFTAAAEVFKALAHSTRAMVVVALQPGERCVCELAEQAGCDMSTMSNHLTVLRHAGVVQCERRGSQVFYRLARPCVLELLRCLGACR